MTDLDLLQKSIQTLGAVSVPVGLTEQIGIPIYNVRADLITMFKSISAKIAEKEKPEEAPEEVPEN